MAAFTIRRLLRHEEFRACERLQQTVWGSLSVSSELMLVTQKYGGLVLGALAEGELVGFLYAFLGRRGGRLIHWSHMMAVAPAYRGRGLGFRMKGAHRRWALEHGLRAIGWTFDPLQSRNAALNLRRLGARVEEYVVDCYGRFPSALEHGLPSDRWVVEWPIASAAVARRLKEGPPPAGKTLPICANETALNRAGLLENRRLHLHHHAPRLWVEIPPDTETMRLRDLALARRWRLETRRIFQHYLASGYKVKDFISTESDARRHCFYVLERARPTPRRPA